MAIPTKPQSREPIDLTPIEDPLLLREAFPENAQPDAAKVEYFYQPTGLDEVSDARRFLQIQFGSRFCPNCEEYFTTEDGFCPYPHCRIALQSVGSPPIPTRRKW